jgi:hypothetical protein
MDYPAHRRPWGQALVAELVAIPGRGHRWRFAAAVLRIALFPPAPKPATARATAAISIPWPCAPLRSLPLP